jgi:hypothetical protein
LITDEQRTVNAAELERFVRVGLIALGAVFHF